MMRDVATWLAYADAVTRARQEANVAYGLMGFRFRYRVQRLGSKSPRVLSHKEACEKARAVWDEMYPPWFWQSLDNVRQRLPVGDDIENLVTFLEADPYAERSGYIKADVVRYLARVSLDVGQRQRMCSVLKHIIAAGDRREYRRYCLFARSIDSPDLRRMLAAELQSDDDGRARRASWMLLALDNRMLEWRESIHRRWSHR